MQQKIHRRNNEPETPRNIAQPTHKPPRIKENTALKHLDECTTIQPKYKIFPFNKLQQEDTRGGIT